MGKKIPKTGVSKVPKPKPEKRVNSDPKNAVKAIIQIIE
jgi:hypothetical protein